MFYPIAAGKAALPAHAGWFTPVFVAAGLLVGLAVISTSRKFIYSILERVLGDPVTPHSRWFEWAMGAPMLVLYFILPYAITAVGLCGVYFGTTWVVQHIL